MTCVPVLRLAIHLEMSSEIVEPTMPKDKAHDEQVAQLQGVAGAVRRADPQNAEHNTSDHDDGQVGQQKQRDA
jgi:hypothetical protein